MLFSIYNEYIERLSLKSVGISLDWTSDENEAILEKIETYIDGKKCKPAPTLNWNIYVNKNAENFIEQRTIEKTDENIIGSYGNETKPIKLNDFLYGKAELIIDNLEDTLGDEIDYSAPNEILVLFYFKTERNKQDFRIFKKIFINNAYDIYRGFGEIKVKTYTQYAIIGIDETADDITDDKIVGYPDMKLLENKRLWQRTVANTNGTIEYGEWQPVSIIDEITMFVNTVSNSDSGYTTIDGGKITTGKISIIGGGNDNEDRKKRDWYIEIINPTKEDSTLDSDAKPGIYLCKSGYRVGYFIGDTTASGDDKALFRADDMLATNIKMRYIDDNKVLTGRLGMTAERNGHVSFKEV